MPKEKNTIIDVIPLTRLPLSRQQSFSYLWKEKIPFGTLVSVPLFRRNVQGIVIGNRDDFFRFGNIKLRKINQLLDEKFLTEKQLKLAEFISDCCLCPLGIVLKFFVTKKTKSQKKKATDNSEPATGKIISNKSQRNIVSEITKLKSPPVHLLVSNEKIEIYLELIVKLLKTKKQVLILVPETVLVYQALDIIKEYFDENLISPFHSQLKGSELYASYQKIKSGKSKIIIGTRQAIFAPFENLGLIIIDEEQDISYKQWDMNPRYNAKKVAEKLAELHNAKIVLSSLAPSVESYHKYSKLASPSISHPPSAEVVDMRKEGWSKDGKRKKEVLISKKLEGEIGFALKCGKQVVLFVNRRGMSSFSICENCKEVLRCPRCERALIYEKEGFYRCLHCNYKTDIFPHCPRCQATTFKNIGTGNQTMEREIKKMFPSAKIKLIDFESLKNKNDQKELFRDIREKKYEILIGTQTVLKGWDFPHLGLIGVINADELLNFNDFNSDERSFQALKGMSEKIKNIRYGKMIIQTFSTEHPVVKALKEPIWEKFYQEELEKRKSLKYPPFYRIIKLTLRTQYGAKMEKESRFVFGRIKILSEENKEISIFEPFVPQLSKIRDKFRKQIILKIGSPKIPEKLEKTLKNLDSDWIIDVDPIGIA
jgi:primosomal protein N' (replication factor Y)